MPRDLQLDVQRNEELDVSKVAAEPENQKSRQTDIQLFLKPYQPDVGFSFRKTKLGK